MNNPQKRREWKQKRKAAGICVQCGAPDTGGKLLCLACKEKAKPYLRKSAKKRRQYFLDWQKRASKRDKTIVFEHYGNKCVCCGESVAEFLTIDHSERNGNTDPRCHYPGKPRYFRVTGGRWYRVIIKLGFPVDLRLLCWNCNHAEHIYGVCPHRKS